jgi:FkbM family methyltransferase
MRFYDWIRRIFSPIYDFIDREKKFYNVLSKGDLAVQVGIDMGSTTTSDMFHMVKMVGDSGTVIGIDADPKNIAQAAKVAEKYHCKVVLINKATYSQKAVMQMHIGQRAGWNTLEVFGEVAEKDELTTEKISVEADTIDNILSGLQIPYEKVSHINLTINGAEYETLRGMTVLLQSSKDLSINVIAGRPGKVGIINGIPDYQAIMDLLQQYGFRTEFKRFNEFFWDGFIKLYLFKGVCRGKWGCGEIMRGVVMAKKGKKEFSWFESYS